MKRSWVLILVLWLTGCATYSVTEKGQTVGPDKSYTVEWPLNWMQLSPNSTKVAVTRDGFGLQNIAISRVAKKDAFPKLKKGADEALLLSELAALQIAEMKSTNDQMAILTVVENVPVLVGGKDGYKLHLQFKNPRGLNFDEVLYGVLYNGYYYLVTYTSPRLYYFDKYLPDFDRTVATFKLS